MLRSLNNLSYTHKSSPACVKIDQHCVMHDEFYDTGRPYAMHIYHARYLVLQLYYYYYYPPEVPGYTAVVNNQSGVAVVIGIKSQVLCGPRMH